MLKTRRPESNLLGLLIAKVIDVGTGNPTEFVVRVEKWSEVWTWVLIGPNSQRIMNSTNGFVAKEIALKDCSRVLRLKWGRQILIESNSN